MTDIDLSYRTKISISLVLSKTKIWVISYQFEPFLHMSLQIFSYFEWSFTFRPDERGRKKGDISPGLDFCMGPNISLSGHFLHFRISLFGQGAQNRNFQGESQKYSTFFTFSPAKYQMYLLFTHILKEGQRRPEFVSEFYVEFIAWTACNVEQEKIERAFSSMYIRVILNFKFLILGWHPLNQFQIQ